MNIQDIEAARERIKPFIFESPLVYTETLSTLTGNSVHLKLENLQMTGSFKERGALNRLLTLSDEERARGVIAASAGNHAQALAFHAGRRGLRCEIWMPLHTPLIKVSSTRSHGASVVLHGNNYDEAYEGALRRGVEANLTFIHAFDDQDVIAGQGTLGLEMLAQRPDLDALLVPVGGGGLIGGIGCAVKERRPEIEIIGVQTEALPSMRDAMIAGMPVTLAHSATVADGIAVRRAGSQTFDLVKKYVDRIITVDEEEIAQAILILLEREKTVAEGAGAAAPCRVDDAQGRSGRLQSSSSRLGRECRCESAGPDYRARIGTGWPADPITGSFAGPARIASTTRDHRCAAQRQYHRDVS